MGRIISHFEEAISGARIIKAFNAQKYVRDSFERTNEEHKAVSRAMYTRQEVASPLSEFLGISVAAAVLFYGGVLQMRGELGMGLSDYIRDTGRGAVNTESGASGPCVGIQQRHRVPQRLVQVFC